VHVEYGGNLIGTTTDVDGRFTLKPLNAGTYTVWVSSAGYPKLEYAGIDVGPDKITFLNDIEFAVSTLPDFEVVHRLWEPPLIDHEEPTKISVIAKDLRNNPLAKTPVRLIPTIAPAVYQNPLTGDLHFKGSRSGSMAFYVDGVKLGTSLSGVPPKSIARITVYTGGIPARFGDITGGVVAIDTQSYFDLYAQWNAQRVQASNE